MKGTFGKTSIYHWLLNAENQGYNDVTPPPLTQGIPTPEGPENEYS